MSGEVTWTSSPPGVPLGGELCIPGDKSISHRAIMLTSIADGSSRIDGFLEAGDTRATVAMFASLGVGIDVPATGVRLVHGVGIDGLTAASRVLDCGNSGTAMRLAAGLLAGQRFDSILAGDASLSRRPMRRVIEPLREMGADIVARDGGFSPLRIRGGRALRGIDCTTPVASAQVKSAILLAGMYAEGETRVRELPATRDHTERMLAAFGWPIAFGHDGARMTGGQRLRATDVVVPGDFSSAAFFIVAATLVPGSDLLLRGVGLNPRRSGLLDVLGRMGADIRVDSAHQCGGEPVADLRVRHAPLRGIGIGPAAVADMIDEFPVLFVAAAAAQGRTVIRGAGELRVKESDRIAVMASGLRALGAGVTETPDGVVIEGGALAGGVVHSADDHRCAMSFAVAGLIARTPVVVHQCAHVGTSFPGFADLANTCGFELVVEGE
ncbi:MAG TPA: 3-phosphoshikimate 1-carboxyvinyltransferase [Rhodanobacteraceae bacterium]|nr:3-phosphoshikimate 1-carboxyvinyltransferase [Rhodanobacteraceae bacterium]